MRALVTRACLYGLGFLGAIGGLAAGCSADDGSSKQNAATLGADAGAALQQTADPMELAQRLAAHDSELGKKLGRSPVVTLRSHGGLLLPARSEEGVGRGVGFTLSERAKGPFTYYPVDGLGSVLELTPNGAAEVVAELTEDSRAVYRGAFGNADLIISAEADHVQHTIVIRDSQSPDLFVWNWKLADGMYGKPADGDRLGIYDNAGVAQLAVNAATIIDAAGKKRSSLITLDDDGFARLVVDHRGLTYPILADFSVFANAAQVMAAPPTIIKGRVLVVLDTSGSMIWHFGDETTTGGDSDGTALFCDNALGNGFECDDNVACSLANGGVNYWPTTLADPSRLYASKAALQNVISANSGLIDFGLERYVENGGCANATYCCTPATGGTTKGRCRDNDYYSDIPEGGDDNDLTYEGSCGTAARGGRILVSPGAGSGVQMTRWIDFVEDFCATGGAPRNPEVRGSGSTPLGRSVLTAREDWYRPIYTASRNQTVEAIDDPLIDCRPYSLVVMSDGIDNCNDGPQNCSDTDSECGSNNCIDADTDDDQETWRCACATDADCSGGRACNPSATLVDCDNNDAACGSNNCFDLPNVGNENWRCGCSSSAQCGVGEACVNATNSRISCATNNDAACLSGNCEDIPGTGSNWVCRCNSNAQCGADQFCDLAHAQPHCKPKICQALGTCGEAQPPHQVQQLTSIWQPPPGPAIPANPVKTYVLGMGAPSGLDVPELDAMAVAGGTTQARLANSQAQIEAAFADIVAQTVKYETCNRTDDNCNVRIDEGLGVYQECTTAAGGPTGTSAQCGSNNCDAGRCTCTGNAQCAAGYICGALMTGDSVRFCRPSCTVGQGTCQQTGVKKCGAAAGQCCVNNASPTCTTLNPLPGSTEICNNQDDNCNGLVDENIPGGCPVCIPQDELCDGDDDNCNGLIDDGIGGLPCGTDVGRCTGGTTQCPPGGGTIICVGAMGPFTEVCNGLDDDCDNIVDGMTRGCYTGPANTEDVGICHGGTQICNSAANSNMESWGACSGQQLPTTEVCNGLNDDCDCAAGTGMGCTEAIDEGIPAPGGGGAVTGDACCPSGTVFNNGECCAPGETCAPPESVCRTGTYQCAGSVVVCAGGTGPSNETCNMLDDNCNGEVDDLPGKGTPCQLPNSCAGTLECDFDSGSLKCVPSGTGTGELCNNLDDDCDGSIDEVPDVLQDPDLMGECNVPPDGTVAPCMPGHWVCKGGMRQCEGDIQPRTEVCNGEDDDCDGVIDAPNPCPGTGQCMNGTCAERCRSGEFPCPGGQVCEGGFCVPQTAGTGGSAGAGQGGTGTGGTDPTGSGGSLNIGGVLGTGGALNVAGTSSSSGGDGAGGTESTAGTSSTAGTPSTKPEIDTSIYGLATGGGGCGCKVAGPTPKEKLFGMLLAIGLSLALARRRRARLTSAAAHAGGAK